jgi:capsular exopolysaccharide synthesis family protein
MELRDYIHVIRARKWVIVQAVVIVTLTALVVSLLMPKSYEGTAQVLITEKDTASAILGSALPLSSQPERTLQTQVQMMSIRPVAEATIKKLGLQTTPDVLMKRVTVSAVGQTNIVRIVATDADAARASEIANAVADEYVRSARDAERANVAAAADEVERRLDEAKREILDLGRKIADSEKADDLQAQLQIATGTYSTLAEKLEQLRINEQLETGPGRVVSPAVVDTDAVSPRVLRNALLGLLVGLLFGIGMAFLYEYLDSTIKSTEEVEKLFDAPVLGTIPVDRIDKSVKRRLAIVEDPGSSTAEAYRVLRNSLDFVNFQNDIKTILVTSAAPGEGKSTVAANLAAALAQAGKKVVLVSVDFRRPTTDQFFNVNNMIGLSDVLLGTHSLKSALQRPGDDQLLVLSAGKMPPNPSELLGSAKMREVVRALGDWGEWVIIDTPPLLAVADPASVARWVDGVLMVSKVGGTTREAASKAMELLGKVGARVIGVVIWGLDETKAGSAGYGYYAGGYYYYSSYYGDPVEGSRDAKSETGRLWHGARSSVSAEWIPERSEGRRFALVLGKLLTGVFAFLVVVVFAVAVAYMLSSYFGWGLGTAVTSIFR